MKNIFPLVYFFSTLWWVGCNSTSTDSSRTNDTTEVIAGTTIISDSIPLVDSDPLALTEILDLKWKVKVPCSYGFCPILKNNKLYALTPENLVILDATTGKIERELRVSGRIGNAFDASITDSVILLQGDNALIAVNIDNGDVLWEYKVKWHYSAPSFSANHVYITDGIMLHSFDAVSGKKIWSFQATSNLYEEVTVHDGIIFVGSKNSMYAIDEAKGKELWKVNLGYAVFSKPLIENETIYIWTSEGGVYAIDISLKKKIWNYRFEGSSQAPLIDGNSIYICGNQLHCVNRITGVRIWVSNLYGASQGMKMFDKYLFFDQTGIESIHTLTVADKSSGKEAYQYWGTDLDEVEFRFGSTMLGNTLFAAGSNDWLYAFKLKK